MAWLARDRNTQHHEDNYVFSVEVLRDYEPRGWHSATHELICRPGRWEGLFPHLHLEPGEGPIEVELVRKGDG